MTDEGSTLDLLAPGFRYSNGACKDRRIVAASGIPIKRGAVPKAKSIV